MMRRAAVVTAGFLLVAAAGPQALEPASGGLWQVSRGVSGAGAQDICVVDPVQLGQWQHRGQRCERTILSDEGDKAVIDYSCGKSGFGRSELTLLTPRTLRVKTQGIAGDGPFNYVIHARRAGNCRAR